MSEFEFPTNIKQIGSIGEGMRIYIEDYACSYLQQFAEAGGYEERLAFLVGRSMVIDGQTVLFISGLVQGLHTTAENDTMTFTDKSWQHAKDEIKRYFKGLDIVGWMQSQPGYGVFLNGNYAQMHQKTFTREDQVMFVVDPVERLNSFYIYDESQEKLVESEGYFIYYDKNRGMHEYMLEHKIVKMKVRPMPEVDEAAEPVMKEAQPKKKPIISTKSSAQSRIVRRDKKVKLNPVRAVNLLVSLSAVLFVVCFVMGAGLVQNGGRISSMEGQLTQLNTAYRDLLVQLRQDNAMSVFASQDEPVNGGQITQDNRASMITEDGNQLLNEQNLIAMEMSEQISEQTALTTLPPYTAPTPIEPTPIEPMPIEPTPMPTPEPTKISEPTKIPEPTKTPEPVKTPEPTQEPTPVAAEAPGAPETSEIVIDRGNIPETYVVKAGDSLGLISEKFYGTNKMVESIMQLNNMEDPDKIYFGKVLKLP